VRTFVIDRVGEGKLDERSVFAVASVSKIVIGLSALKVFADHGIPLTTPVNELAPDLPLENPWEKTNPVRLIHLLEHTSGLHEAVAAWPDRSLDDLTLGEVLSECF